MRGNIIVLSVQFSLNAVVYYIHNMRVFPIIRTPVTVSNTCGARVAIRLFRISINVSNTYGAAIIQDSN